MKDNAYTCILIAIGLGISADVDDNALNSLAWQFASVGWWLAAVIKLYKNGGFAAESNSKPC